MIGCLNWCSAMKKKASEEGNFKDWQNYEQMEALWRSRVESAQKQESNRSAG